MSDAAPSGRRGRSARRERRQAGPAGLAIPYISRNIPNFDILSDEGAERIEANTDRILAEIGLEFRDDPKLSVSGKKLVRKSTANVSAFQRACFRSW